MIEREQTLREELANALSHGIGFLLAAAALPVLIDMAERSHGRVSTLAVAVFGLSMMAVYAASAIYHALPPGRLKAGFQRLDHAAIFLFIAGSYTPFVLGPLRGAWGFTLCVAVWVLALAGIVAKVQRRLRHPLWSTALYVAMGWMALPAIEPLIERVAPDGLVLLFGGGFAYTVGAVFYLLDNRVRYAHFVWHLFVLAGSTCHFFAALSHAAAPLA